MANPNTEKHNRLLFLLAKCCAPLTREMVRKQVKSETPFGHKPWTLQQFILKNKQLLEYDKNDKRRNMIKNHRRLLFPTENEPNLEQWDFLLTLNVLLDVCDLPSNIKKQLETLKEQRTEVCNAKEQDLSDKKYDDYPAKLKEIIDRLLEWIGDEALTSRINKELKELEKGLARFQTFIETWRHNENRITDQMKTMEEKFKTIKEPSSTLDSKFDKFLPDVSGLQAMVSQYGRKSDQVVETCDEIRMQILASSEQIIEVCATYKPETPDNIIFIAYCESDCHIEKTPPTLKAICIQYQYINTYRTDSYETCAEKISFPDKQDEIYLTNILQKTSSHYMKKHSNLNIMTASPVKSRGFGTDKHSVDDEPCIVFHVRSKGYIPTQDEKLPNVLGHYKTDVREGAFVLYNDPEPLKIGCSIAGNEYMGTLGGFVSLVNGQIGCITSAHVLLKCDALFQHKNKNKINITDSNAAIKVYQPPDSQSIPPFGEMTSVVYKTGGDKETGVEACLITITDPNRYPDNGRLPKVKKENDAAENDQKDLVEINYMSGNVLHALPDEIGQYTFYKYGAITRLTRGAFKLRGSAVRTSLMHVYENCELHNQIEICSVDGKPFAEPGDSGALVLVALNGDLSDLKAIGILTGGDRSGMLCYVTPIWEVLNALELPLQLKNFNSHDPMETDGGAENTPLPSEKDNLKQTVRELDDKYETVAKDVANLSKAFEKLNENVEHLNNCMPNIESAINDSKVNASQVFYEMRSFFEENKNK